MRRTLTRAVAGAAGLTALALAGCTPGPIIDRVPEAVGGLPTGAPQRPESPYQFPAVHDMPAPRAAKPLSEEDQVKLEKDLEASRDRQAEEVTKGDEEPAPPKAAKKKPAATKTGQNTGAKANP
jgi:hypothetical protein